MNSTCTELKPLHYGFVIKKGSMIKNWKIRFAVLDSQRSFTYFVVKNFNSSKTTTAHLMELIEKQFYWKQSVDLEGIEIFVKGSFILDFQCICLAWHKKRFFFKLPKGSDEYFSFFVRDAQEALDWKHILTQELQVEFLTPQQFKAKLVSNSDPSSPQGQTKTPLSARFSLFGRKSKTNSFKQEPKEEIPVQETNISLDLLQKPIIKFSKEDVQSFLSYCQVYHATSQQFICLDSCFIRFFDGNQLHQFDSISKQILEYLKSETKQDSFLLNTIVEELEYWKGKEYCNTNKWKLMQKVKKLYQTRKTDAKQSEIPNQINSLVTIWSDADLFYANYFQNTSLEETQLYSERKSKIKLILSEMDSSSLSFSELVSPILSKVPFVPSQQSTLFQSSVFVGNFLIEWNTSEFIIPKRIANSISVFVADVEPICEMKQELQLIYKKLSQVIVDWNINYHYKALGFNCQTFVNTIVDLLEIDFKPKGILADYLEMIQIKGNAPMIFTVSDVVKQECQLEQSTYRFASHWELDSFVTHLKMKCPMFQYSYPNEYTLLKTFDRAFWLRYFTNTTCDKYQPACAQGHTLCPFDDPRFVGDHNL